MLSISAATQVYLVAGATDMRKSFNGLMAIVKNELQQDVLSGHIFAFSNRRRNRVKLLFWDRSGLWVCAKRLERGTFAWPQEPQGSIELSPDELTLLLGGIDLQDAERRDWYRRPLATGT
jgi:transposase